MGQRRSADQAELGQIATLVQRERGLAPGTRVRVDRVIDWALVEVTVFAADGIPQVARVHLKRSNLHFGDGRSE